MVLCRLLGVGGLGTASAASSVISRLGRSGVAVGSGTLGVDGLLFMRAASMRRVVGLRDARRCLRLRAAIGPDGRPRSPRRRRVMHVVACPSACVAAASPRRVHVALAARRVQVK